MRMRPLDKGLAIEPGKTVKLAPGRLSSDDDGLRTSPLKKGDKVPVTLGVRKGGQGAPFRSMCKASGRNPLQAVSMAATWKSRSRTKG